MEKRNLLLKLQRKYHKGGYALIVPETGKVLAFGLDLEDLYTTIDKGKIKDADKLVMYIPPPKVKHVFHLSLSMYRKKVSEDVGRQNSHYFLR